MKAIITGGGTGGHIYPALAVAAELKKRGWDILYLGSKHRMEAEIVPAEGYDFRALSLRSLPRKISLEIIPSLYYNSISFFKALKIIYDFKADVVIGTGGFVAGPIVLAGAALKKKTLIHEQNAYPGITNKLLARIVDKVCLNFSKAEDYLKVSKNKIELTGNPVRPEILNADRNSAYRELNLDKDKKTILITGGSLGAEIINKNTAKIYQYALNNDLQIIHLTGKKNYASVKRMLKKNNIQIDNDLIKVFSYLNRMEYALAAADLIISRAGATALAEITSRAIPSILIPYAAAAEEHQLFNANTLVENGAAVVIEEKDIDAQILFKNLKLLINDKNKLRRMSEAAAKMSQKNSLNNIIEIIESLTD